MADRVLNRNGQALLMHDNMTICIHSKDDISVGFKMEFSMIIKNKALGFLRNSIGYLYSRPGMSGTPGMVGFTMRPGRSGFSGTFGESGRGGLVIK